MVCALSDLSSTLMQKYQFTNYTHTGQTLWFISISNTGSHIATWVIMLSVHVPGIPDYGAITGLICIVEEA